MSASSWSQFLPPSHSFRELSFLAPHWGLLVVPMWVWGPRTQFHLFVNFIQVKCLWDGWYHWHPFQNVSACTCIFSPRIQLMEFEGFSSQQSPYQVSSRLQVPVAALFPLNSFSGLHSRVFGTSTRTNKPLTSDAHVIVRGPLLTPDCPQTPLRRHQRPSAFPVIHLPKTLYQTLHFLLQQ